jgi:aryl-alcohol dehydrogenase-like predicted oxidoreductase
VVLATKVGNVARPDGKGLDWDPSKKHILSSIDHSLKRLQTDHIDLYQLHGGTIADPIEDTIEAFEMLKQQGKIRYYGISSIRPNVIAEYVKRSSIISVMMQYSLLDRRPEESCLDLLYEKKIGVLARGGLAQGLLVNKPPRPYLDLTDEEVMRAAEAVKSVSGSRRSNAQTALRYVLHHPAVTSAVVGIRTMEQLIEVAATTGTPPLTDDEIKTLKESVRPLVYKEHRK